MELKFDREENIPIKFYYLLGRFGKEDLFLCHIFIYFLVNSFFGLAKGAF